MRYLRKFDVIRHEESRVGIFEAAWELRRLVPVDALDVLLLLRDRGMNGLCVLDNKGAVNGDAITVFRRDGFSCRTIRSDRPLAR